MLRHGRVPRSLTALEAMVVGLRSAVLVLDLEAQEALFAEPRPHVAGIAFASIELVGAG